MAEVISQPGGSGTDNAPKGPAQSTDRTQDNFEPTEDEKKVVDNWLQRAQRAEDRTSTKAWREGLEKLRKFERGGQTVDDKKSTTNMIYATLAAQIPKLYAKNPAIAVSPTDAVPEAELGKVKRFAATGEKVLRKMLVEEGKLKKRAKANIRSTSVTSYGVVKMVYQSEYRGDPVTVRRIEDTQDNLARVEKLVAELKKSDDPSELAKKRDELAANLKSLTSKNEVRLFKGFVVDRVKSEDFLLLDDNVAEFDEYVDAEALGHKVWMTVGNAKTFFKVNPHGATRYNRPRVDATSAKDETPTEEQYICVVEVWDKKNGVVRTTAKGMNRWLREPYAPEHTPMRWYPFYVLGFNLTESEWLPLSDVEMLMGLQEEYDRTRKNYRDARKKAVPVLIFRKGGELTEPDIKKIVDRGNEDTIGVEGNPAVPLTQDLLWFAGAQIDPQAYDVSIIRNDMDIVSGSTDASRANLIQPKTATEAEIMADAMESRLGERRDTHEDLLSEMGEAALEICLRDMNKSEVQQIAGADAEWPDTEQGVETVFRQVSVKVRAGSSGKPNQAREREQWGQLMPIITNTMKEVGELRANGHFDQAEASLELLRETLRRYDEHLDIDAIIPPTQKDKDGKPMANQQAAAELMQCKQALQQCQEQVQQLTDENTKLKAGEQSKLAQTEADERVKTAAAEADAGFQRWKAILDAAVKVQQSEIQAAATANVDDQAKREQAMKAAASEDRLMEIVKDLKDTLGKLGSALERQGAQQPQGAGK